MERRVPYKQLLDTLFDGVYFVDRRGRITHWNRAAEQITGYARGEVIGTRCSEKVLTHVDEEGRNLCHDGCPLSQSMADGQGREVQVYLQHKGGHRVRVVARTIPLTDEEGEVCGAIEVFTDGLERRAMARQLRTLERLALVDELTEIPNRRYLERNIKVRLEELRRLERQFGVLLIDVDRFKSINDTLGHGAGDDVLRVVSRTLVHTSRGHDMVGRWGGDEFLAVAGDVRSGQLVRVGERFRAQIEASRPSVRGEEVRVTSSIGAAIAAPNDSIESLIKRADEHLYQAKRSGRNRVCS